MVNQRKLFLKIITFQFPSQFFHFCQVWVQFFNQDRTLRSTQQSIWNFYTITTTKSKRIRGKNDQIVEFFWSNVIRSIRTKKYVNNTKKFSAVYKTNDEIYFNIKDFCNKKSSKKLDYKIYGPYKIIRFVEYYACKLEFPAHSNTHFVIYVKNYVSFRKIYFPAKNTPHCFF